MPIYINTVSNPALQVLGMLLIFFGILTYCGLFLMLYALCRSSSLADRKIESLHAEQGSNLELPEFELKYT